MPKLDNKQKLTLVVIIIIMLGVIAYYLYLNFQKTNEEVFSTGDEEQIEDIVEANKVGESNVHPQEIEEKIKIHIAGAVQQEGIYEIEDGSRIADAIEKAGGLNENASTKNVNLAYKLEDGQKIYIPTTEEEKEQEIKVVTSGQNGQIVDNGDKTNNKIVNINTANQTELEEIPGVGESTAQKILEYRNKNGKFKTIEEIKNVSGIGEMKYEQMKEYIKI